MDLDVPYAEKDAAKALGARWDRARRCWYVPDGLDPAPFLRWIPVPRAAPPPSSPELNLRSTETYLVIGPRRCWKCGETTRVAGFLMAPGFKDFSVWEDQPDGDGHWGGGEGWCYAHYVAVLPPAIAAQAAAHVPNYRRGYSRTLQSSYWASHCTACDALQGDFELFEEPGAPFLPWQAGDVSGQRAWRLQGVFEAGGSFGYAIDLDLVRQIPGLRSGPTAAPTTRDQASPSKVSVWKKVRHWLGRRGG